MIMGYRLVLGWNVFTLLFLFAATFFSHRQYKRLYSEKTPEKEEGLEFDSALKDELEYGRSVPQKSEEIERQAPRSRRRINSRENARYTIISAGDIARETRQRMNSVNKIVI